MPNLQPFETHLATKQLVADNQRAHYLRPVRNYLTFYEKSAAPAEDDGTIKPATLKSGRTKLTILKIEKIYSKKQTGFIA